MNNNDKDIIKNEQNSENNAMQPEAEEGTKQGTIKKIDISAKMKKAYVDYAMSVIIGRAIPDVRDGLKPVHRRIMHSMNELGLTNNVPYRKCARIVGDVLGKYHPHGDAAVYDALVLLAQDFSTRYPLVEGHGNFGSVDGDGAAAMRYTEAKMSKIADTLLSDIDKNTVDFMPNFDGQEKEPTVLPNRVPNLLVNGTSGIAVGMATEIPPHNLNEVIDGTIAYINNEDITIDELMQYIKAPDFPTGGLMLGTDEVRQAYTTGRGKCILRAKAHIEEMSGSKSRIVVTEIPYKVNKAKLIEDIAELVKDKKVEDISDVRDESNKIGMRIVVDLKRSATPQVVLNQLFKYTKLQCSIKMILLALDVNGRPKVFNLKEIINRFVEHRINVVRRRVQYDLKKANTRKHLVEGLIIALDNIDRVIQIIRSSKNTETARNSLMAELTLSEVQAQYVLDMRLSKLTGTEKQALLDENKELEALIEKLQLIISTRENILSEVKKELIEDKTKYGDKRRTEIISSDANGDNLEDLVQKQDVIVTFTHRGYIKRMPLNSVRKQNRGGQGTNALARKLEDYIEQTFICTTHDTLTAFTEDGTVYKMRVIDIPEASKQAKGMSIVNLLPITIDTKIATLLPVNDFDDENSCLVFVTKKGMIKKTLISEYKNIRSTGIISITLNEGDSLKKVILTTDNKEFMLFTQNGMSIRYSGEQVKPTGRNTAGVRGIKLNDGDELLNIEVVEENKELMVLTEKGYSKRTSLSEYTPQNRGGKGYGCYNRVDKNGLLVGAKIVAPTDEVLIVTKNGVVMRIPVQQVTPLGRYTIGSSIISLTDDSATELTIVSESED